MQCLNIFRVYGVALLIGITAIPASARTLEQINASGHLVVATEGAYPPFNYFQNGKLTGFEVELVEAIAKKMGLTIDWKSLAFDALLAGLQHDRWDMVTASFAITDARARAVTFTLPHYCSGSVIVSRDPRIHSPATLAGKSVGVQTGSTYLEQVEKISGVERVKNFPQDTDARSALVNGRVDAWVSDRFVVKAALNSSPGLKRGDYLQVEQVASAVRKGNVPLAAAVNKALTQLMADGTYNIISQKYLQEDVRCK
ncbi:MAG: ABC transporter substrate-binding protein [Burkholderiaceae bacterium]